MQRVDLPMIGSGADTKAFHAQETATGGESTQDAVQEAVKDGVQGTQREDTGT